MKKYSVSGYKFFKRKRNLFLSSFRLSLDISVVCRDSHENFLNPFFFLLDFTVVVFPPTPSFPSLRDMQSAKRMTKHGVHLGN